MFEPVPTGRYERKFVISKLSPADIELLIRCHPAIFSEIFYKRAINNVYLDTVRLRHYQDSVTGVSSRRKIRIRWYGDICRTAGSANLEVKSKNGLLVLKHSYPIKTFALNSDLRCLQRALSESELPVMMMDELTHLRPSLFNRYQRKYFLSADRAFRITLDTELVFMRPDHLHPSFFSHWKQRWNSILELKYSLGLEDEVTTIANFFPFRMTKSSKYAEGIERLSD